MVHIDKSDRRLRPQLRNYTRGRREDCRLVPPSLIPITLRHK
jgi:hypothetical protein